MIRVVVGTTAPAEGPSPQEFRAGARDPEDNRELSSQLSCKDHTPMVGPGCCRSTITAEGGLWRSISRPASPSNQIDLIAFRGEACLQNHLQRAIAFYYQDSFQGGGSQFRHSGVHSCWRGRFLQVSALELHLYHSTASSNIGSSRCTCEPETQLPGGPRRESSDRPFRGIENLAHASQLKALEMLQVKHHALARVSLSRARKICALNSSSNSCCSGLLLGLSSDGLVQQVGSVVDLYRAIPFTGPIPPQAIQADIN